MSRSIHLSGVVTMLVAAACNPNPDARVAETTRVRDAQSVANRFDPARAQRGDTVVGLVLDSIIRQQTPSGEWVGSARFAGSVLVTGRTFRHHEADYPYPCFEADSSSAASLPRWAGDERRPWFCFENPDDARTRFGGSAPDVRATIRVDRFTIHRNLTDAVNVARLVEVVELDRPAASAERRCFSTTGSVLARSPGTVVPGPARLGGWLIVDSLGTPRVDHASARLVDSDGRGLGATWRRIAGDSIQIVGFDDFLRVEMRLALQDRGLTGSAVARSDAALERDSVGGRVPFQRRWRLVARPTSCDRVPLRNVIG